MMRFKDKVVISTGGANGIGKTTAESFAKEGAKVVIADFSDEGQVVSDQMNRDGYDTIFVKTDVTNEDEVKFLIDKTVETYGRLDIMFANAGIARDAALADISKALWDATIGVNLTGVFLCDKYAVTQMLKQGGGVIVNTGSIHSLVGQVSMTAYAAAKGGVKLLTATGALNYAKDNIRINTICPGYIDTPLLSEMPPARKAYLSDLHPVGRMGTAQEVANAVLFLASDDASFVSGSYLTVDGGYTSK